MYRDHEFIKDTLHNEVLDNIDINDMDNLLNNKILSGFVDETMRHNPSIGSIPKKALSEVELNGHKIEKDTVLQIPISGLTVCPHIFGKNVREFDPKRFVDNTYSKFEWMPFGAGVKMCLGWNLAYLELKLLTALFVKECTFEIDETRLQKAQSIFNFYDIFAKVYPR